MSLERVARDLLENVIVTSKDLGIQPSDFVDELVRKTPKRRGRPPAAKMVDAAICSEKPAKRKYSNMRPKDSPKDLAVDTTSRDATGRTWIVVEVAGKKSLKKIWKLDRSETNPESDQTAIDTANTLMELSEGRELEYSVDSPKAHLAGELLDFQEDSKPPTLYPSSSAVGIELDTSFLDEEIGKEVIGGTSETQRWS